MKPADKITIAPGAYKLVTDIPNPLPDRRHVRDWRKRPVWEAGTEFVVLERNRTDMMDEDYLAMLPEDTREKLRKSATYTVVQLVGDRHPLLHEIGPGHAEQYAVLAAHLAKTGESQAAMFTRLGCDREFFAFWLVEQEKVSREQFEAWWQEYQGGGSS